MTRQRVPNAELYRDTARQNLLTNGGFEIWQRGNGPFTVHQAYMADRWWMSIGSGGTMSASRDSANAATGSQYCAAVTVTKGTGGLNLIQAAENIAELRNRVLTLSAMVKTTTPNAVRIALHDGTTPTYSAFHSGSGAYEQLTITLTMPAGATGGFVSQVNFNVSCTAYIDNAMLVVGNVAADYAPLHPADDLARCLRYYETIGPGGNFPQIQGYGAGASQGIGQSFPFAAKKSVVPTMTTAGTFTYINGSGLTNYGPGIGGTYVQFLSTGAGVASCYSNNSGYIIAEANP